ncbi:hypothetical protein HDF12_004208 [Edaphobacter lichenicola]|uniref:Uncharacterized protein n=1 Tax=Tunturiibacter lichenicola TaxID=2051959 RepID=A0A7Y9NQR9_9BACT|nr:hypothetical protein [Edaphobacter lichenicola]
MSSEERASRISWGEISGEVIEVVGKMVRDQYNGLREKDLRETCPIKEVEEPEYLQDLALSSDSIFFAKEAYSRNFIPREFCQSPGRERSSLK